MNETNDDKFESMLNEIINNKELEIFMFIAINDENIKMIKVFIEKGVNINYKDQDHESFLFISMVYKNIDIILLLLDNGANVNEVDTCNNSLLFFALHD